MHEKGYICKTCHYFNVPYLFIVLYYLILMMSFHFYFKYLGGCFTCHMYITLQLHSSRGCLVLNNGISPDDSTFGWTPAQNRLWKYLGLRLQSQMSFSTLKSQPKNRDDKTRWPQTSVTLPPSVSTCYQHMNGHIIWIMSSDHWSYPFTWVS